MDSFFNFAKLALERGWAFGGLLALFFGGLLLADHYGFTVPIVFKEWFTTGFIFGIAALLISLASHVAEFIGRKLHVWNLKRNVLATLLVLDAAEKDLLRQYIRQGQTTLYVSIYDGVANGLQAKGIIYRASQLSVAGTPGLLFPWNLQPIARKILNERPNLLD